MNLIKKILKATNAFIIFVGITLVLFSSVYFFTENQTSTTISSNINQKSSLPVNLRIPAIKVNTIFVPLGLNSLGEMEVPGGASDVGWYAPGPVPGDVGSSVVAGHSGWKGGAPAVFDSLYKLEKGDLVYVKNAQGDELAFVVKSIKTYNPKDDAFEVFNSSDGLAHLNLVTCSGVWDTITKSHTKRLVVFTDRQY